MQYHTDYNISEKDMPGPKFYITCTFYVNDDYDGGEPIFWHKEKKVATEYKPYAGDVVIFPSGDPILHGVKKINSGDKYFIRLFWGWDYEGSEEWLKNAEKYGEEAWRKMETARMKKEIWNGKHHFDVVWSEEDLSKRIYQKSDESPSITPILSKNPKILMGKGHD